MRWDRLFADLEDSMADVAQLDQELLAADLSDELWSQTSWRDLVGGSVTLVVRGVGTLSGSVRSVNPTVMRLAADTFDMLVATGAVIEVVSAHRRSDRPSRVEAALGWGSAMRRLRDADEDVRMVLFDGTTIDGFIDAVGADFVRLQARSGRRRIIVFDAIVYIAPNV